MNTLIILDWDDTLFPTSWIMNNNNVQFKKLDHIISLLLNRLVLCGQVIIITNAILSWINNCLNVLPKARRIISINRIQIISARQHYQDRFDDINEWKKNLFVDIVDKNRKYNIISIGDADYEYRALINLYYVNSKNVLKSVKLLNYPSYDMLIEELSLLYKIIPNICKTTNHLDLNFGLRA